MLGEQIQSGSSADSPVAQTLGETGLAAEFAVAPSQTGIMSSQLDRNEPARPPALQRYQVQRGDSLLHIAANHGVSVADLIAWNRYLEADTVLISGEWIWIPLRNTAVESAVVAADESPLTADNGKSGRGGG